MANSPEQELENRKLQHTFSIAYVKLKAIEDFAKKAAEDASLCDVKKLENEIGCLNPELWFQNQEFNGEKLTFYDLPEIDRQHLRDAMLSFNRPMISPTSFSVKCKVCANLAEDFGKKVLALFRE